MFFDVEISMKILYLVTQSSWGGAQKYVFDLATNLPENFAITVACGGNGMLIDKLKTVGINVKIFKNLVRPINPIRDFICFWQLWRFIRREKFDIVHTNSSKAEILGNLAARVAGVKKIFFTAHGFVFNEPQNKYKREIYIWLEKFANKFSRKIIAVSNFDRQTALQENICPVEKIVTVHNGLDCDKFERAIAVSVNQREKLGLSPGNFVVGTVANFYPVKGLKYFISAAALVVEKIPNARFVIVGEGELRLDMEKQIRDLNLEKTVILTGFQADLCGFLPAFDLFVLPSLKEGFPYALLEAQVAGLPIIATRVGGVPEIIIDYSNGLLIEKANESALAQKIIQAYQDENLRKNISQKGKYEVKKKFDLRLMIEKTSLIYDGK
jgi:glycosyltransferase involved in cell wall biosynthesis